MTSCRRARRAPRGHRRAAGGCEAEHKQITALFCRFPNAGAMAERLGHAEMHARLASATDVAAGHVRRFGGTVNQMMADGFVALFGAPVVHEDDARRAVLAALEIRGSLLEDTGASGAEPGDRVTQMGIDTGQVIVGRIAGDMRMEYTAIGDATDLASVLQHCAGPGVILISDATRRLVEAEVRLAPIELTVPGRSGSLTAWNVIELAPDRAQLDHRLSRTLAPFVGRRQDLAVLQDSLEQAATGRGQVINVVGEPGIGKSRLLYEFRHAGEPAGTVFFEGRCLSYASSIPYVPIVDIVRQACGITERDSAAMIRQKAMTALALREVPDVPGGEAGAYLLHVLGVGDEGDPLRDLSPEAVKARTFSVLSNLVLCREPAAADRAAGRRPALDRQTVGGILRDACRSACGCEDPARRHLSTGIPRAVDGPVVRHADDAAPAQRR